MATLVREDAAAARSMMLHFSFFNTSFIWLHAETLISYGRGKKKNSHQHWRRQASVLDGEQRTNLTSWTAPGRSRAGMRATTYPAWFKAAAG